MIGGVKADEIDPAPVAVVRVEFGRVLVGERAQFEEFGRAGARPERLQPVRRPAGALALDRRLQRRVGRVKIVVGEFDRLVEHFVGCGAVRVEGRAEIVLSVGKGVHGLPIPVCREATPPMAIGKDARIPVALGRGAC